MKSNKKVKAVYDYFYEKYEDDKKAFNALLDLVGYRINIDSVSSPSIHYSKFDDFMDVADLIIESKDVSILSEFLYDNKLTKEKRPTINKSSIEKLCQKEIDKATILIQDPDIRCGEKMKIVCDCMKDREYIYYGVSENLMEYKIALIFAHMHSIPAFIMCSNVKDTSFDINAEHWYKVNGWKKITKRHLDIEE